MAKPIKVQKAVSVYTRTATIIVQLNNFATHARGASGDVAPWMPDVKMTVEFVGVWESKEKMDADMDACINKLAETYRHHISGSLLSAR